MATWVWLMIVTTALLLAGSDACSKDSDCLGYCDNGVCKGGAPAGTACAMELDCAGYCNFGHCLAECRGPGSDVVNQDVACPAVDGYITGCSQTFCYIQCNPGGECPKGRTCSGNNCALVVGGSGDPLFTLPNGGSFFFLGRPNTSFALLSEAQHQLNTYLVDANINADAHHPQGGTFMKTLAFQAMGTTVMADVTEDGRLTVFVNGRQMPEKFFDDSNADCVVEAEPFYPDAGQVLIVITPLLQLRVTAVKPFVDATTGFNRGHLDFEAQLLARPEALHGVIGQFMSDADKPSSSDQSFHGEGSELDYALPHLLSSNFTFGLFKGEEAAAEAQPGISVARRMMSAVHAYTPLKAPITIKGGSHISA